MNRATVRCKWCSTPTEMLGTRECDRCHELRLRTGMAEPELLAKILGIRLPVFLFAREMEAALRAHDAARGEAGWRGDDTRALWERLLHEASELHAEVMRWENGASVSAEVAARVRAEAADVANFAMMIWDNAEARE